MATGGRWNASEGRAQAREAGSDRFFEAAPALLAVIDGGRFVRINAAWRAVLGYEPGEMIGVDWREFVHPHDVAATLAAGASLAPGSPAVFFENRYRTKAGDYRALRWTASIEEESGLVYAVARDATDVFESREELYASRAWLDVIFAKAPMSLWALDLDGRVTVSLGTPPQGMGDELVGRTVEELYEERAREIVEYNQRALAGELFTAVLQDELGNAFESHFAPLLDPRGEIIGSVGVALDVTERERALAELRTSEQRYRLLVELSHGLIWTIDTEGRFTFVNDAARVVYRCDPSELGGRSMLDFVAPEDRERCRQMLSRLIALSGELSDWELEGIRADGSRMTAILNATAIVDKDGRPLGATGSLLDITSRKQAERLVSESEEKYRRLVETTRDVIWSIDAAGRFTFVNQAVRRTHGLEPEEMVGRHVLAFVAPEYREGSRGAIRRLLEGEAIDSYTTEHVRADGTRVSLEVSGMPLHDHEGSVVGATGTATDVTERKRYERELRYLADHDALTGLLNRRRFEEGLDQELARDARYGDNASLLVLDLDNFKYVNDTLGHNVGDEMLVAVAGILRDRLRDSDVVARLSGDEFAVLLPRTGAKEARAVARDVAAAIRAEPVIVGGQAVRVTASVGITEFRSRDLTGRELLGEADLAMYEAKEAGRDRVGFYSRAGHARMHERRTWAERVREALETDGFVLYEQPILDVRSGAVSQHELLVRMRGQGGQPVLPDAFMPAAERFGLVEAIDRWVVTQAIELIQSCVRQGREVRLEVNLSGRSFGDPELPDFIADAVQRAQIPPHALIFEITETAAIASLEVARGFASRLTGVGCRFAVDDFGTGFGSFHYLKYMPIDYVKLDGDFIRDLAHSHSDQVLVRAMADVARGLGMKTVAEWVESEATLEKVREFGVDYAQGYHVGRPRPASRLGER
ncbi:MAG: PAS domain S-box protein [Thermoleophilaceae bacterium]|nr:PAS domain S-box protein [Thermoleophilaceae bacterium]